ncbi:MAG: hypothetical protein ACE5HE_07935 [Phycisphaerae bacterium]
MTSFRASRLVPALSAFGAGSSIARQAFACSVCFGDPESPMAKGAAAGVLVLAGFIGFVLLGVAGAGLFWVHRSRRTVQTDGTQTGC